MIAMGVCAVQGFAVTFDAIQHRGRHDEGRVHLLKLDSIAIKKKTANDQMKRLTGLDVGIMNCLGLTRRNESLEFRQVPKLSRAPEASGVG